MKRTLKDAESVIEHLVRQFGVQTTIAGVPMLGSGGLSALEAAFDFIGWPDPKPFPENRCRVRGCGEWATCGMNTRAGYKRVCGKHFRDRKVNRYEEDANR